MRIWSIHPSLLDAKGLVALWRETLLAKHVLEGKTKGYKNHPQLNRFKAEEDALGAISFYLLEVYEEACRRGYCFTQEKIGEVREVARVPVRKGQVLYELEHVRRKLKMRDAKAHEAFVRRLGVEELEGQDVAFEAYYSAYEAFLLAHEEEALHPLFVMEDGDGVEDWEVV